MRKRKSNLMLRLASLLLACVIISTYALCGLLARYTTTGSGSDSARVIKFGDLFVTEEGDFVEGHAPLIPGIDLEKDVTIRFGGSEASTIVFVEMYLSEYLTGPDEAWVQNDDDFSLKLLNADLTLIDALSFSVVGTSEEFEENSKEWYFLEKDDTGENTTRFVYYKVLTPNMKLVKQVENSNEVDGSFFDNDGKLAVGSQIPTITLDKDSEGHYRDSKYKELIKTKIDFKVTAVQANGFDSVSNAWDSIK